MKSLSNKTIRTKDIRVKSFVQGFTTDLEREMNDWLASVDYEIISINFTEDGDNRRVYIIYKI